MFDQRPKRSAEVVLVGRSNVGKSTLMRELTGHSSISTGRRPGVTQQPNHYDWTAEDFMITDLPGFGFMSGISSDKQETIKTNIVQYIEKYADNILVGILVIDGKAAVEIIDRHAKQDEIPHDLEMFGFLQELEIPSVIAVNKIDKIENKDKQLDEIADRFGLYPPWQQWSETIAPISAKRGQIDPLNQAIRHHLHVQNRDDLFKFF